MPGGRFVTVTNRDAYCAWCGGELPVQTGGGRPRRYCRRSHRQRAYEARRLAAVRHLAPDEVLLARSSWDALRGALRRLQEATRAIVEADVTGDDVSLPAALGRLNAAVAELQDSAEARAVW